MVPIVQLATSADKTSMLDRPFVVLSITASANEAAAHYSSPKDNVGHQVAPANSVRSPHPPIVLMPRSLRS